MTERHLTNQDFWTNIFYMYTYTHTEALPECQEVKMTLTQVEGELRILQVGLHKTPQGSD